MDHDGREAFGSWYEDYQVGDIYKHWPGRTVNEYDDTLFSMITMNHAPLHIDEHYMSREPVRAETGERAIRDQPGGRNDGQRNQWEGNSQPGVRDGKALRPNIPRRHDLRGDGDPGKARVEEQERPWDPVRGNPSVEPEGRDYTHAEASGDDTEEEKWGEVARISYNCLTRLKNGCTPDRRRSSPTA